MNRYDARTLTIADFEFHTMRPDVRIAVAEMVDTEENHSTRWLSILKVGGGVVIAEEARLPCQGLVDFASKDDVEGQT